MTAYNVSRESIMSRLHRWLLALACLGVFWQGVAGDEDTKKATPADIEGLIKQLGSDDFDVREAATRALMASGPPALDALRKATKGTDAEVVRRAARLVEAIENGLDQLLTDYRGYGLPLPAQDAKLVRFESGGRYVLNGKLMPPTYFLGFLLKPGTKDHPPLLLVGTEEIRLDAYKAIESVEPKPDLVKGIDVRWWEPSVFGLDTGLNAGLAVALQCKARGWDGLAQELWAACLKQDTGKIALADLAWAHSKNEQIGRAHV